LAQRRLEDEGTAHGDGGGARGWQQAATWCGAAALECIEQQGEEALQIGLKSEVGVAVIKWNTVSRR
jgi:hypothetical protein